jgi:hypothetical protein
VSALAAARTPSDTALRTEYAFELPTGYVDEHSTVHRTGIMRLATARDEIMPLRDPRVRDNEAYLTILLLSRVIVGLGALPQITPGVIESLYARDLAFLQDLYRRINIEGTSTIVVRCPNCQHEHSVDTAGDAPLGGLS